MSYEDAKIYGKFEKPLKDKINEYGYNDDGTPDCDVLEVEIVAHKIDRILKRWRDKCTRLEIMSGDVGYFELKAIIDSEIGDLK